jgi:hypothetical protein
MKMALESNENPSKTGKLRRVFEDHPAALGFCEGASVIFMSALIFCFVLDQAKMKEV